MAAASPKTPSNTRTIARNSFWFGIEMGFTIITVFATSIPMARMLGPAKLGYFNYVMWLANMSGIIGSIGIPATTRKYIAEYLGKGAPGVARAIFFSTLRLQCLVAGAITCAGLILVFTVGDPAHRIVSALQVASMLPSMAVFVPAQTNAARENLKANVAASIVGGLIYVAGVVGSLFWGWDLLGIAIGILLSRSVEFVVRFVPVFRWVRSLPKAGLPQELRQKMLSFSGQNMVLMLLNAVVWDRSDMIFLKALNHDIRQVTFYTVAFNLTEKIMLIPQTFGQALGASVMAQFGRDRSRLFEMVSASAKYMFLCALPLLLGVAALSSAVIRILYGVQYIPAIPVLMIGAILAVPKPLLLPAQHLMQANERQMFLVVWNCFCGAVNILLDILLIPSMGATGAAIANGCAQALAVIGIWIRVLHVFDLRLHAAALWKILFSGTMMAGIVWTFSRIGSPWIAAAVGIPAGALLFVFFLRITSALVEEDRERFLHVQTMVPSLVRPAFRRLINAVIPAPQPARA